MKTVNIIHFRDITCFQSQIVLRVQNIYLLKVFFFYFLT